ncbi:uncharacterized protein LOC119677210 [Teleopsis dalmanni]|uniref:uncharacterized protein LOC119677210 n=1 Tax=Teleopsis dalmanni TaxID=139649 RepID=UPI0018CF5514|nr:uncharacterized protein LOC119677210 [Teleopsis dalmanni]
MVVLSKLYSESLQKMCCNEIIHSRGCTDNLIHQIPKYIQSNMKYFAVLTLLPLLLKINKLNRKIVKDTLTYYANTVFSGFQLAVFINILICAFRRRPELFGRYNIMFLPVFISGLAIHFFWVAPRVKQLFGASILQVTIDSVCLRRENVITRAIANSKGVRTLIFMFCSAIILHAKQKKLCKTFWIVTPNEQPIKESSPEIENSNIQIFENENNNIPNSLCNHKTSCRAHVLTGLRNYLTIGLSLDTIKMVMSRIPKDVPYNTFISKLWAKLKNYQFNTTALLAASVGIYRNHISLN